MANKTVLITGAANRIGAVITKVLHADGLDIIIHYNHSGENARLLADGLNQTRPGSVTTVRTDLLDTRALDGIESAIKNFNNRLDVLINNASSFYPTPVNRTTDEQWQDLIGTNMKAPFFLSQLTAPYLKQDNGCIINITDIHADRPMKGFPVYSAAKSGLAMLTRALAWELAPEIRVNGIAPGAILWPEDMDEKVKEKILSRTALKRSGNPDDIARAARFIINNANYMTGQILTIDGGRSLYI